MPHFLNCAAKINMKSFKLMKFLHKKAKPYCIDEFYAMANVADDYLLHNSAVDQCLPVKISLMRL
jgi:hypothetical protein